MTPDDNSASAPARGPKLPGLARRASFSVGGLIFLVAIVASCLTLVDPVRLTDGVRRLAGGDPQTVTTVVVVFVFGTVVGAVMGVLGQRHWIGFVIGAAAGALASCVVAAITIAPISPQGLAVVALVTLVSPMVIQCGTR